MTRPKGAKRGSSGSETGPSRRPRARGLNGAARAPGASPGGASANSVSSLSRPIAYSRRSCRCSGPARLTTSARRRVRSSTSASSSRCCSSAASGVRRSSVKILRLLGRDAGRCQTRNAENSANGKGNREVARAASEQQPDGLARRACARPVGELAHRVDGLAVECRDHVAAERLVRGGVVADVGDAPSLGLGRLEEGGDLGSEGLEGEAPEVRRRGRGGGGVALCDAVGGAEGWG